MKKLIGLVVCMVLVSTSVVAKSNWQTESKRFRDGENTMERQHRMDDQRHFEEKWNKSSKSNSRFN